MENDINIVEKIENFGKDGAEQENEAYLAQYFIETNVYHKAAKAEKTIIIGRKGSGKSAIFRFLKHQGNMDSTTMSFFEPDDASQENFQSLLPADFTEQAAKNLIWKRLFLTLIAQYVVEVARKHWDSDKKLPEQVKKIREFLVENDEATDLSTMEKAKKFASYIKPDNFSLKINAIGEIGIGTKQQDKSDRLYKQIEHLENYLSETMSAQPFIDKKFHIYVDQVDDIWKNDEKSSRIVAGLLLAAYDVNSHFNSVRCIVFIRTDIYQLLDFHNKDHLHSDELEIEWNKNGLRDLLLKRASGHIEANKENFESLLFKEKTNDEHSLDYIIDRTLLRPRDLIQFCNSSLEVAKHNKNRQILPSDIFTAEIQYSKWKLSDLVHEYKTNYPFLNTLLVMFGKQLGFIVTQFSRLSFENKFKEIQTKLEQKQAFLKDVPVETILAILYNINFLGTTRQGKVVYRYEDPNTIHDLDDTFSIHPAFWKALGIGEMDNKAYVTDSTDQKDASPENLSLEEKPDKATNAFPQINEQTTSKPAAEILAGSDEVKAPSYHTALGRLYAEYEAVVSIIEQISNLEKGKAKLTRVKAYVYQTQRILLPIIEELEERDGWYSSSNSVVLIKAAKLLEATITGLEEVANNNEEIGWFVHSTREAGNKLNDFLLKFYKTLIDSYDFDVLKMRNI